MATFAEQYKKKKSGTTSGGSTFAERFKSSDIGRAVRDDYERKLQERKMAEKQRVIDDSNAKAEKYYQEAEKASSFMGLATETAKGVGRMALGFGKEVARMPLTVPLKVTQTLTEGVTGVPQTYTPVTGVEKFLYGEQPRQSYLQDQNSIQKWGQEKGLNRGSSIALGALGAGGEVAFDLALPGFGKAIADSIVGKAMKSLASRVGIGARPRVEVDPTVAKEAIDEITEIQGKPVTPEDENAILDAFSDGKTKEEIVTSVGKEKIVEGFEPKPRAAEVVAKLETNGEKLSLEEIDTVKTALDEGKSFEEIQTSLRTQELAVKSTPEPRKVESNTNTPDSGDEAFLKAVETRFKESKTNKFREYNIAKHDSVRDHARQLSDRLSSERQKSNPNKVVIKRLEKAIDSAEKEMLSIRSGEKYRLADEDPLLQEAWKGKTVTIYRGTGPNSPLEGNYFTLDKNYAREFLGSGRPEELKKVVVPASDIYKPKTLPDTTSVEQMDRAIAEAKANGFKAVYALEGGTDKPSVFYIDKVSKDFYNQPLYNKAQGGKNRLADDFERVTGQKITPEQEAKIIALNKKLFGDEDVKITAQLLTPEGQKAFGVYKNKVIKILDGQADPTDTFYHEAVHKYLDLFTTLDEQKKIYVEARKLWKTDNLDDLEEKIAENFIRYAKTSEGVTGTLKEMFDKVIDRIKVALGKESEIEALYKDILEGKAKGKDSDYILTAKEATKRENTVASNLAKDVEKRALANKLEVEFSDLAEYAPQNRKEQAELSASLMSDKQKTLDVIYGDTPLPEKLSGSALSKAIELHGDSQMINALKGSKILSDVSQGASELSMRVGIGEESVVKAIKKVEEIKTSKVKEPKKKVAEEKKKVKSVVEKARSKRTTNLQKANALLDSLICK